MGQMSGYDVVVVGAGIVGLAVAFCDEHDIDYRRCGKLIIARHLGELTRLDELERRGRANGVVGLTRVTSDRIPEIEPYAVGVVTSWWRQVCRS